MGIDNKKKNAI